MDSLDFLNWAKSAGLNRVRTPAYLTKYEMLRLNLMNTLKMKENKTKNLMRAW